jgi:hypothetical protein
MRPLRSNTSLGRFCDTLQVALLRKMSPTVSILRSKPRQRFFTAFFDWSSS